MTACDFYHTASISWTSYPHSPANSGKFTSLNSATNDVPNLAKFILLQFQDSFCHYPSVSMTHIWKSDIFLWLACLKWGGGQTWGGPDVWAVCILILLENELLQLVTVVNGGGYQRDAGKSSGLDTDKLYHGNTPDAIPEYNIVSNHLHLLFPTISSALCCQNSAL